MPKPDYASLFAQYEVETDPAVREQLWDQIFVFGPEMDANGHPIFLPGETVEDYLLTPEEEELFEYTKRDYVENNPGTIVAGSEEYVLPFYVLEGYINIEASTIPPYVLFGYVDENYFEAPSSIGDFIAYVGEYYNESGETT